MLPVCATSMAKFTFIGSHNWTNAAFKNYDEISLLIESEEVAELYKDIISTRIAEV